MHHEFPYKYQRFCPICPDFDIPDLVMLLCYVLFYVKLCLISRYYV